MDHLDEFDYARRGSESGMGDGVAKTLGSGGIDEPHRTNGMLDTELIGYCEFHCMSERALFSAEQFNRMVELAGNPPGYRKAGPAERDHFISMHESMETLCQLARARLAASGRDGNRPATGTLENNVVALRDADGAEHLRTPRGALESRQDHPVRPRVEGLTVDGKCDFCRSPVGRMHALECIRGGFVKAPPPQGDRANAATQRVDAWSDPASIQRRASVMRFQEACAARGLEASSELFGLWQDACQVTQSGESACTLESDSIDEIRDRLRSSSILKTPLRLSVDAVDALLDHIGSLGNPKGATT